TRSCLFLSSSSHVCSSTFDCARGSISLCNISTDYHRVYANQLSGHINNSTTTVSRFNCSICLKYFGLPIWLPILVKVLWKRSLFPTNNPLCNRTSKHEA